ncbi:hypothetical protein L473_01370 [Klebsiella pneumoniae BIDMC 36]|uniref:hypothetical protein n=1 Tax=Klebsiella pneumoniae TaxID=573 RepID=UPI0003BF3D7F|nr:hypothetical protein [Klebsiella pneumoniae]ESL40975.1 hypothetical protein L473_01370 [Klebsiella pneumoniae BIDMC 36]HCB0114775.1 hypothetical protein [Klebsiella pneumoniae]
MTAGPFEKRGNVTLASGEYLYRDAAINDACRLLLDFGRTWPGGNKTSGYSKDDVVKNLCYTDDTATVGNAMSYDGGGIKSSGNYLDRILLPESAILPASCTRQLITLTFKLPVTGYDPQNTARQCALFSVGSGPASATTLSAILANSNAGGGLNNMQFQAWGASWDGSGGADTAIIGALGTVTQVAMYAYKVSSTQVKSQIFVNGSPIVEKAIANSAAYPAEFTKTQLFSGSFGSASGGTVGTIYRAGVYDMTSSDVNPADIVALDYSRNYSRFS